MGNTITIRVAKPLSAWLQKKAERTGMSQGQIVREQLEQLRRGDKEGRNFMRLAGVKNGPRDLSTRKGFAKP
jgi:predicted transcriptional regulator